MTTKSHALPPLDAHGAHVDAHRAIDAAVAEAQGSLSDQIKVCTSLLERHETELRDARTARDQIALSVLVYGPDATTPTPVNVRVGLSEASGLSRTRLSSLRARSPRPTLVTDARSRLPKIAYRACYLDALVTHARRRRDEAVEALLEQGWTNQQLADLMGRDSSRVAQLRSDKVILDRIAEGLSDDEIVAAFSSRQTATSRKMDAVLRQRIATLRKRRTPSLAAS